MESPLRDTLVFLRARREALGAQLEELDTLIAGLQKLMSGAAVEEPAAKPKPAPEPEPQPEPQPLPPPVAAPAPYANMDVVDAARHYLRACNRPMPTREIAEALIAGGYPTRSRKFVSTVNTLLRRAAAAGGDVRRNDDVEWYIGAS